MTNNTSEAYNFSVKELKLLYSYPVCAVSITIISYHGYDQQ